MKGFIDIHTHVQGSKNAIINRFEHFEQDKTDFYYSLGLHPWYLTDVENQLELLKKESVASRVLAIGECGLDKVCDTKWETQIYAFEQQIALAEKINKPLIIHCVRAYNECLKLLKNVGVPAIFHGFNKKEILARSILEAGFYLSFGTAMFNPGVSVLFRNLPLNRIFLETDDQISYSIEDIYKSAAESRNIELDALILQIEKNFEKVFL